MSTEIALTNPIDIISKAVLSGKVSMEVVERLTAWQLQLAKDQSERDFNNAMHSCQMKLKPVVADVEREDGKGSYASYEHLDSIVRPIYIEEGLSLSFSDGEPASPGWVRIVCHISGHGHTRVVHKDMPISTTGPRGNAVMTAPEAQGASGSRAKRLLLKDIFNIAVTKDGEENPVSDETIEERNVRVREMERCESTEKLAALYRANVVDALKAKDYDGIKLFDKANDKRRGELNAA